MWISLEVREPFIDHEMLAFCSTTFLKWGEMAPEDVLTQERHCRSLSEACSGSPGTGLRQSGSRPTWRNWRSV